MKEKQQQTIEGEVIVSNPTRPRLANIKDVRREIAAVYKEARLRVIPTQEATRLVYMLISLGNMIKDTELEERITELEKLSDKS
tara:strand:+ start:1292 stop:1543 length:252 start_codon:yes stop_codon:yes gene_type:complete